MERHFLFVLASTRREGNSEALARHAARALSPQTTQRWLRLIDHPLPPFADTRHSSGYGPPQADEKLVCEATLAASDLVIVTPVNWYSLPWPAKLYFDHWSAWMRVPELSFKATLQGRNLWGVIVDSGGADDSSAGHVGEMLRMTAAYMSMHWRGALVGHANRPGEIANDAAAWAAGEGFFSERGEVK